MATLRAWVSRLWSTLRGHRGDRDLEDELRLHQELAVEDERRRSGSPEGAARTVAVRLGGVAQAMEAVRDRRSLPLLETTMQDLRYATRTMRKRPVFAGAAIVTLGLAIGVNTAIFSFGDALAFRPPNVPRPGELVRVFTSTKDVPFGRVSYPDYLDFKARSTTLSNIVAYAAESIAMSRSRDDVPQALGAFWVSGNYFSGLGVEPTLGRGFRDDDDRVGASPVVVISHGLWERSFQADPAVIGQQIALAKQNFTVIGVAPAGFNGTELISLRPDLYIPIATIHDVVSSFPASLRDDRSTTWLTVVGRLKPKATALAANAEMTMLGRSLEQAYPRTNHGRTVGALSEAEARGKPNRALAAALFLGLAGLVLLIACANVANLILSHAAARAKEIAVRLALGASRARLVRQLLAESLVLACSGGLCGLVLGYGAMDYLSALMHGAFATSDVPVTFDVQLDTRVVLFTLFISLATSLVCGLTPAFRSTRVDLLSALKVSTSGDRNRRRWMSLRNVLVASQVALSVVVLDVAGHALLQFLDVRHVDPGFRTEHVLLLAVDPSNAGYDQKQTKQFYDRTVIGLRAVDGVEAVGLAQSIPLVSLRGTTSTPLIVDGFDMPKDQNTLSIFSYVVDAGYWRAMRTPILRGRPFEEQDTGSSPLVVVVNETMARRYWPNRDVIGSTVRFGSPGGAQATVVGVSADGKYDELTESPQPALFIPFSQTSNTQTSATMVVRTTDDPRTLIASLRSHINALDANVPVFDIRTLDNVYDAYAMLETRLFSHMMIALGLLGTVLAIVGLYGVVAYLTTRRTREIGIRMALGADRPRVLLMVLRQADGMVGVGIVLGIGLSLFVAPAFISTFHFAPRDGVILGAVSVALIAAAFTAALIPAHRAATVNPVVALQNE